MDETFGGSQFNAADESVAGAKSDQKGEGVAPVLINQLLITEDPGFKMWGMNFGFVSIVALIRNIETASTRLTYLLEDYTGQIEGLYWIDDSDSLNSPDVMINNYARIYGTPRRHGGKKSIMIFRMYPIQSINEVTTHLLDVLTARYKAEKFSKGGVEFSDFGNQTLPNISSRQQIDPNCNLGLGPKHYAVYQAIKAQSQYGDVSVKDIQPKFRHIDVKELESIVDFLAQEGHIYASIDTTHFLCTEA